MNMDEIEDLIEELEALSLEHFAAVGKVYDFKERIYECHDFLASSVKELCIDVEIREVAFYLHETIG